MAYDIDIQFERPKETAAVRGRPSVGRTTEGPGYACFAHYAGHSGYGSGETPEEAKSNAVKSLLRELDESPPKSTPAAAGRRG